MRVLRTVTIENSAATKNPLANTSARTPARRHKMSESASSIRVLRGHCSKRSHETAKTATKARNHESDRLCFSVGEKVGVDEVVDDHLVGGVDLSELNAHADAAIAPRDLAFRVDIALGSGHTEPDLDRGVVVE